MTTMSKYSIDYIYNHRILTHDTFFGGIFTTIQWSVRPLIFLGLHPSEHSIHSTTMLNRTVDGRVNVSLLLQGKQKQAKRSATFNKFCEAERSILLCTNVAARGLDIKNVDWIFQYDPPDTTEVAFQDVDLTFA